MYGNLTRPIVSLWSVRRSWAISKGGELTSAHANEAAHADRISAAAWHGGFLYTASADGCVKMWDASLELVSSTFSGSVYLAR